jgi:hypothetical protein
VSLNDEVWATSGIAGNVLVGFDTSTTDTSSVDRESVTTTCHSIPVLDQHRTSPADGGSIDVRSGSIKAEVVLAGDDNHVEDLPGYLYKGLKVLCRGISVTDMHYENGPIFKIRPNPGKYALENMNVLGRYQGDLVAFQEARIRTVEEDILNSGDPTRWVCKGCVALNLDMRTALVKNTSCQFCGDPRQKRLPPLNEMPGKVAICSYQCQQRARGGRVFVLTVHPELNPVWNELLIEAIIWSASVINVEG